MSWLKVSFRYAECLQFHSRLAQQHMLFVSPAGANQKHTQSLLMTHSNQSHTITIFILTTNGLSERSVAWIYGCDLALSGSNGLFSYTTSNGPLWFVAVEMFTQPAPPLHAVSSVFLFTHLFLSFYPVLSCCLFNSWQYSEKLTHFRAAASGVLKKKML